MKSGFHDNHYYFPVGSRCSGFGNQERNKFIKTHTAYECIKKRCEEYPDDDFFGYREMKDGKPKGEYIWLKNNVILEQIDSLSNAIMNKFKLKKGDAIGFISKNRYEWYVAQFAMQKNGIIPVPLYATLGEESIDYIIDLMKIKIVFGSLDKTILKLAERNDTLHFVLFDMGNWSNEQEIENDMKNETVVKRTEGKNENEMKFEMSDEQRMKVMKTLKTLEVNMKLEINENFRKNCELYEDLLNEGRKMKYESTLPSMNDICIIIFTSGTSGTPKGAIHTFKTFSRGITSINEVEIFSECPIREETVFSYLPSAHVLEQQTSQAFMYGGGKVGFNAGGIPGLVEDLKLCKPTYFACVPRVLQKIYDMFLMKKNQMSCIVRTIFDIAYANKRNAIVNGTKPIINWDSFVFNKVSENFGGKLKFIFNGGAPLTPELYEWARVCTCSFVMQSYGMTEACGGCVTCLPNMNDPNILSCGFPCDEVGIRLSSVEEMNYLITNKEVCGEIEMKGGPIFTGYYQNDVANKESFTEDGWFKTGDIGRVAEDGSLQIIDRKKNLFKLAQGEYIAVEPLEGKYDSMNLIGQSFIFGDSTDTFIVGVIVPDVQNMKKWFEEKNIKLDDEKSLVEMCKKLNSKEIKKQIMADIIAYMKNLGIPHYELIRNVFFYHEAFSTENDLLTPSFKLKRMNLKKFFEKELIQLRKEVKNNEL